MKKLLIAGLAVFVGFLGWYFIYRDGGSNETVYQNQTPTYTESGFSGQDQDLNGNSVSPYIPSSSAPVATGTPFLTTASFHAPSPSPALTPRSTPISAPTPKPAPTFVTIGEMAGTAEHGVAAIYSDDNGNATVFFNVVDGPQGVYQPAYIYVGNNCQTSAELYAQLNPLFGGTSTTTLNVKYSDLISHQNPLVIVIHKSYEQAEHRFACGLIG